MADGYTDKVVKYSNNMNFVLDKIKLESAGLSALSADTADGSETVSFDTSRTTLMIPDSNFLVSQDGSYSYRVHINLQSTGGYPYLSGTTLYANGCPIYVSGDGKVYFDNKTDGSHTEPVKNLLTGDAQITLGSWATIYGGSAAGDVTVTVVDFEGDLAGGSSGNGTVTVNAGTAAYHSISGSVIGVPAGGAASNVVINAPASVTGSIFGASGGSVAGGRSAPRPP